MLQNFSFNKRDVEAEAVEAVIVDKREEAHAEHVAQARRHAHVGRHQRRAQI